jgi:hypothetical protein
LKTSHTENYDIIGDIHGFADSLEYLLQSMGYKKNSDGYYQHHDRIAVFVGDFVDRGNQQKAVINLVRPMVDNGTALAVMGNHEFNAISYHTNHPQTAQPLRKHNNNHTHQHQAFLDEYVDKDEITNVVNWFKSLPLFLELDEIRIIHACWSNDAIANIENELDCNNCLVEAFLVKANLRGTRQFDALETLLKGLEMDLPNGKSFKDSYGKSRTRIRIKWWQSKSNTFRNLAIVPKDNIDSVPDIKAPIEKLGNFRYPLCDKPVFCGHYWFMGKPVRQQINVACLDYSVAKNGNLTAYRWNKGDKEINNENYFQQEG